MSEQALTKTLAIACFALTLIAGLWLFIDGRHNVVSDAPLRILLAGFVLILFPGFLLGSLLGMGARHPLEAIAKSFSLSLSMGLFLALPLFWRHDAIGSWVGILLAWNLVASAWIAFRKNAEDTPFLSQALCSRWANSDKLLFLALIVLSGLLYRWGDDVRAVDWEVSLHLSYIRQYSSGLPLDFAKTALRPELALSNLFQLWEFLLSGITWLSGRDPLVAAMRCRWLIPFLGLSSFFFMALEITQSLEKARAAVWIAWIAAVSQFLFLPPSPMMDFGVASPIRELTAFMGSIHHSDTAMEILLPLSIGYLFGFLKGAGWGHWFMLGGVLIASFFWHPREYFQLMWYAGIAFAVDLLLTVCRSKAQHALKRYVYLGGLFLCLASFILVVTGRSDTVRERNDEFVYKSNLWQKFKGSLAHSDIYKKAKPPFRFPFHSGPDFEEQPSRPMLFSWLVLTLLLLIPLGIAGTRADWWLGFFFVSLWFFTLCWNPTQTLLSLLSYTEILYTQIRFLPLFAYVLMGLGWHALVQIFVGRPRIFYASTLLAGFLFAWIWKHQAPEFRVLIPLLSVLFGCTSLWYFLKLVGWWVPRFQMRLPTVVGLRPTVISFVLFVLPICPRAFGAFLKQAKDYSFRSDSLFSDGNPIGISSRLVHYLREEIPARSRIQVSPTEIEMIGVYSPMYVMPLRGNLRSAQAGEFALFEADQHPLFNSRVRAGHPDFDSINKYLLKRQVNFVLGDERFASEFRRWAYLHPERFQIAFQGNRQGELLLRVLPQLGDK